MSALCYGLGYASAVVAFLWMARRRGLNTEGVRAIMLAGLIGGLAAANVTQWLFAGTAGKSILGGAAGGYLTVALYKLRLGIRRPLGDLFAVARVRGGGGWKVGLLFRRLLLWQAVRAAVGSVAAQAYRHPTQLYLSAGCVLILAALWQFERLDPPENGLFFLQGALYCVLRFAVEFFRDVPTAALGLTLAQWVCLAGLAFFAARLFLLMTRGEPPQELSYAPV